MSVINKTTSTEDEIYTTRLKSDSEGEEISLDPEMSRTTEGESSSTRWMQA